MKAKSALQIIASTFTILCANAVGQTPNLVANNDTIITTTTRGPVSINSLLSNDTDADNDPIKILNVGTAQFGRTELRSGNTVVYTPGRFFTGEDSFTYRINDRPNGSGNSATGTVRIRNPFLIGRGIYATSISGAGGSHDVSGYVSANVTPSGKFTCTLRFAGDSFRFRGQFDLSGNFSGSISRAGLPSLQLALLYAIDGGVREITGFITAGAQNIPFTAPKVSWSYLNTPFTTGRYTFVLPAPNTAATTPQGAGFMTTFVNRNGVVIASGRTGDNLGFTSSTYLGEDESTIPIYGRFYRESIGTSGIFGDIALSDIASRRSVSVTGEGDLHWFVPRNPKRLRFPGGLDLTVAARGSAYNEPAPGNAVLFVPVTAGFNGQFTASGGNIRNPRIERASVGLRPIAGPYQVSFDNSKRLKASLVVTARNGTFGGTFFNTATRQTSRFSGVFIQGENKAYGIWTAPKRTGSVELVPDEGDK